MNRVLHVVYQMDRGGAETWLMHVLRRIDRERFPMDFLVHTTKRCAYDDEIRDLGGRLFAAPHPSHVWAYERFVRRVLRDEGPYSAVHVHCHLVVGQVLHAARRQRVPVRILHSHNTEFSLPGGWFTRACWHAARPWARRCATAGLACSEMAASAMFGSAWQEDSRWRVLPCSLDLAGFAEPTDSKSVRRELALPPEARVIGHVGRFHRQKNHAFLVNVAAEAVRHDPRTHLLLVGDGPLRPEIEREVDRAGIRRHVTFAGARSDVPRLMTGAMDAFVFPSLHEGLGLVLVEAEAAGLSCICSDGVPREADVVPQLVTRLRLADGPAVWAEAACRLLAAPPAVGRDESLSAVFGSRFNLLETISDLENVYTKPSAERSPQQARAA